jgi:hypothetical protein
MHSATAAAKDQRATLDPALFSGGPRQAYEVAAKNPALLAQLHCYCGCDRELGHRNLLDCYRDEHAGHCPTCTGEAFEASQPVFGQIKQARGFRHFLLRGLAKVRGQWALVCLTHNILKLYRLCYA